MIKKDTVLEHLSETYIAYVYFTKPFICCSKLNFLFYQFQQRNIFGMTPEPKYTKRLYLLFRDELFLRL